jgi:hypothetical protein
MDIFRKKSAAAADTATADTERRRIARIVHDDRGNATVNYYDAPSDYKRQVLEVESDSPGPLSIQKVPRTFNPYECATLPEPKKAAAGPKKDLKKLSEWIKMMRELEEKKRRGEIG